MTTVKAKKIIRRYAQKYNAKADKVFPLLCAVREMDWIPGWEYEMIHSVSGANEEGCVFKTQKPYGTETVWVTTKWDTENYIVNFVEFAVDAMIVNLNISLQENPDGTTTANWEQIFTSLSDKGDAFIEVYTEEKFKATMAGLEKVMGYFLETGKLMGAK